MKRITVVACLMIGSALLAAATFTSATAASAKPPGEKDWMMRMMVCEGDGVRMELYLPHTAIYPSGMPPGQTVIGYYALDLSDVNKGKPLEPVRVTLSADKQSITVDQYTRGLPPTRIPVKGGTVDFDQRFGKGAKCGPFQPSDPNFGRKQ